MKLERNDIEKVASRYNFGTVQDVSLIDRGVVNFNYDVTTDRGRYVVRALGKEAGELEQGDDRLEFRVLDYLDSHGFRYEVPRPMENSNGDYLSTVAGERLWVYPWIDGETTRSADDTRLQEIATALATYHRTVEPMEADRKPFSPSDWLLQEYEEMQDIEAGDDVDRLVDEHAAFMQDVLHRLHDFRLDRNVLPVHSDFIPENLLFDGDSVVGVLDFDLVQPMPRMHDVAYTIQITCFDDGEFDDERIQMFLNAYQEYEELEREEKDALFPMIAVQNCYTFWWTYREMEKRNEDRLEMLRENVAKTRIVDEHL